MKLIVSQMNALSGYVSREFHYIMTDLIKEYGWKQIDAVQLFNAPGVIKDKLVNTLGKLPEIILFWEGYEFLAARFSDIYRLECHKLIFADDLHWWNEQMRLQKLVSFGLCETILSPYAYLWDSFYPELAGAKRLVLIPHSASPDFTVGYNLSPENSILLSGAVSPHYPLRQQLRELHEERDYPISYHPHPGYHCQYDYAANENVGRGYAKRINRYRAAFTDGLIHGYVVAKHFEIPATGALLVADDSVSGPLRKLGFTENEHYFTVSKENLEERIRFVLDKANHEELDVIRLAGQELVRRNHQSSDRARRINEVASALYKEAD